MENRSTIASSTPVIGSRTDIINELISLYDYETYLEIGLRRKADNFDKVHCSYKVAVDPNQDCEYRMTSDEFFALYDRRREFDLVFVDGLHTKDQALRDIINALANLSPNGAIVVHDCNPTSEYLARPYAEYKASPGPWNGSVWQAIAELRMQRADLEVFTFDIDHGTAVVRRGRQELFVSPQPEPDLDYAFLEANRKSLLNLVQPHRFMELIGNRTVTVKRPKEDRIDVVYALSHESEWAEQKLRYALRSIEKNFQAVGNIWLLGEKPVWLKNVREIPYPDGYESNNEARQISAIIRACLAPELSTEFLFMSDDQCLLSPVERADFKLYYLWDLYDAVEWKSNRGQQRLKRTFEKLRSENKPAYHLDAHIPYLYNKRSFPEIMLAYDYGAGYGYSINMLYLNNCLEETLLDPSLQVNNVRAALCGSLDNEDEIRDIMKGKKFLTYSDRSFTPSLKKVLDELFPNPSEFEATEDEGNLIQKSH